MPVQATEVLSDEDVRNILNGWTELDPEHVDLYVSSGVGRTLIHLERSGFECSEEEYLLCPDTNNEPSKAYLHGGNFALPPGTPGHTPWPGHCAPADGTALAHLPADVDASPPFALGRFIVERIATAVDLTNGTSLDVILLPKLGVFSYICIAVQDSLQFRRRGVLTAADFGVPVEPQLVRAFLLGNVKEHPDNQVHFTRC
ncbi:hypothetical protein PHYSODRAFT_332662 [Phytophthora sojae]|uniref:Uncharacterized protein n=1 Tax=Phytophthora sojae (strain P6497) TaxID=1094619 RepID=G4ZCY8_PHYSP|nr:hypothetical protein PHYSODRAFT_332662 [Phytophthora sojae]EGZ18936.1 hypothetical protein PHYSODRAFT_332662 [Phytophthora sojae]|eukprot:XP_009527994.1 hypothetical protein PHYSODRAFT_332662 [Phytophthora sojae]